MEYELIASDGDDVSGGGDECELRDVCLMVEEARKGEADVTTDGARMGKER